MGGGGRESPGWWWGDTRVEGGKEDRAGGLGVEVDSVTTQAVYQQ